MKFADFLIKTGLKVAGAGLYLLARKFVRKLKRKAKVTIEKVEHKLEKKPTVDVKNNENIPVVNV